MTLHLMTILPISFIESDGDGYTVQICVNVVCSIMTHPFMLSPEMVENPWGVRYSAGLNWSIASFFLFF
jgi:hypothetical protein